MTAPTFPTYDTVDLFAGPGGWSLAAKRLGLREIGLEFDKAAHLTRRAAGFYTIRDDVRRWGPVNFPNARGLIASPPCQTFSAAGKGAGRRALDVVLGAIKGMHLEHITHGRYDHAAETYGAPSWEDERTGLVLEPLRWALGAIRLGQPYEWLAFEQVPTVLPVWQAMAEVLRTEGYSVAVGNLQAEQYGVPQTRKRAVLVAQLRGQVSLPVPTHSKFHVRDKTRLDLGVLPWVSMAQALGWENVTVRSNYGTGGDPAARGERTQDEPSATATVTSKVDRNLVMRQSAQARATVRAETEPAPTITAAHDRAERVWIGARFGNQEHSAVRGVDEPAATLRYGERMNATDWVHERPATTVVGSFNPSVIAAPGYRVSKADGSRQNAAGSVRVTVQEAAVLQSFPEEFPWQGSRTKQFQQVGNAIPPLLAEAVLRSALGRTLTTPSPNTPREA